MRNSTLKHIVKYDNCKKDVLDHMVECPFCKSPLKPSYYIGLSEEKRKKIKLVSNIIGFSIAIIIVAYLLIQNNL